MMNMNTLRTTFMRVSRIANKSFYQGNRLRPFSTIDYDTSAFDNFIPTPPAKLTVKMAGKFRCSVRFSTSKTVTFQLTAD